MAMTAQQLQQAIDSIVGQIAAGVQQIRYPDGSGITYVDASQAENRLRLLRAELGTASGAPVRTRVKFYPTAMRRYP